MSKKLINILEILKMKIVLICILICKSVYYIKIIGLKHISIYLNFHLSISDIDSNKHYINYL